MRDDKLHMFSGVHLNYEIDMCRRTASLLTGAPDGVLNDVLVESYAIHLRTLIEFLYGTMNRADDLTALNYVKDRDAWLAERGAMSAPLEAARERANKQIAHFTKKRFAAGRPETQWRPGLELPALVLGLRLFLQHAAPERLHPNVAQAIDRLALLLGETPSQTGGQP